MKVHDKIELIYESDSQPYLKPLDLYKEGLILYLLLS